MISFTHKIIAIFMLALLFVSSPITACDDTLVMLLTAKNPTSEFSKTIRSFMNSLTQLGSALKYTKKDDYSQETNSVLEAWLDFSKKYMTNPPEEAKNDRQWQEKMGATAKKIGDIRKQVNAGLYMDAHNNVLELSNTIGSFFDSVGISDEKKIFLNTSSHINDLQMLINSGKLESAKQKLEVLKNDLLTFKTYITPSDASSASNTADIIDSLYQALSSDNSNKDFDSDVNKLRTSFEELRSRILMNEWFSE